MPSFDIDFEIHAKVFNQEGDLKYEYNAFRNLKDSVTGELRDLRSDKFNFSLNHPVDITVQPSYDGTVNVILNDDLNPPRMINSRFTPIEDDRYVIIDRKGNNDTNIYEDDLLTQTTRLFKTTEKIPFIDFQGLSEGGTMKCGNYVFYFKYCDADGNESDIVAESGIISCYVGKINDPFSTRAGLANELTNKIARLRINNLDNAYDYVNIYYTRSTSDYSEVEVTEAYRLANKKAISGDYVDLIITGFEDVVQISVEELNIQYNIVDRVRTQAQVQNMLFFGNVDKPTVPYKELEDLALRVYPTVSNDVNIGSLDKNYKPIPRADGTEGFEYYDAQNVYRYTGYWNKEMYRFGIVYILNDDSLSPVFNIRGKNNINTISVTGDFKSSIGSFYTYTPLYNTEGKRAYVESDDDGLIASQFDLENTLGVVRLSYLSPMINKGGNPGLYPLSINFNIEDETLDEIRKYAKGFFFVRQKRIPTILAQGLTLGVDNSSNLPALRANILLPSGQKKVTNFTESFMDKSNQLAHNFRNRVVENDKIEAGGIICPEATLRSELYNSVFTGTLFNVSRAPFRPSNRYLDQDTYERLFYVPEYTNSYNEFLFKDVKLTLIEDSKMARSSGTKTFSTRAGIPEEAWRYSFFGGEDKSASATTLIRGAYTGFIGMENYNEQNQLIDIHIPGFDTSNLKEYFQLRGNSFHPFYPISDRYDLRVLKTKTPYSTITNKNDYKIFNEYRGDCFINSYTTRIQRNFQDPELPVNDAIVDTLTWKNNYSGYTASGGLNKENIAKINRSDVNAVQIGHWLTFKLCSNINLAYRAVDESNTAEFALTGKARAFHPFAAMSHTAENKIPESTVVNVGYNSTTGDKQYIGLPDVPYIKNIFDNRIMFSDIHINDAFKNNYRVFQGLAYKDISRQYGAIVKMFDWKENLMVVFEHGVGILTINERALTGQGANGPIYIKGAGVLPENIVTLSTDYGSSWRDSILRTKEYVYGVDATAKKIWRTNGESFEVISDFKIQKYLNDNITLGETERTPMVALRNVKTHYNAHKGDVMFTFYDTTRENVETEWNICYNELIGKWITRYSWTPLSSESINNIYFSFDRDSGKNISMLGYSLEDNPSSEGIVLDNVTIPSLSAQQIATISLKGYDYYDKYKQVFTLEGGEDNGQFTISDDNKLNWLGASEWPKYSFKIKVRVSLQIPDGDDWTEIQYFYDYLSVKADRSSLSPQEKVEYDLEFSTWFWKHGQAGRFDITETTKPTFWYGRQHVFEFEFIVADHPEAHKIFNNLVIISNNAEPDSFEFEVVGDTYDITRVNNSTTDVNKWTNVTNELIHTYQKARDIRNVGRARGNMHYKEDLWDIEIKPHRFQIGTQVKEARIRDKYVRIKVRYSGEKLAIITALQTLYTISYA